MVAAWSRSSVWFTASTPFANPAITIARFAFGYVRGIVPADAPRLGGFIAAQLVGALLRAANGAVSCLVV